MYLLVEIDGQEPKVYHLTKSEILIGSGQQNHIILNLPSISKSHLKLLYETEQWQVVDKGSTNGSYYGKNQLTPGKRCLFNPGESVRLGDKVIIKLLSEAQTFLPLPEIEVKSPVISGPSISPIVAKSLPTTTSGFSSSVSNLE